MTGTLINAASVAIGSLLGWFLKRWIDKDLELAVMHVLGAVTLIIGLNGLLSTMLYVDASGTIHSSNELLLLGSMCFGLFMGEKLRIQDRIDRFGAALEKRFAIEHFTEGFVAASAVFCVGAMSIVGSMNDGLYGDYSMLVMKSGIDFIAAVILGASLGISVMASAVSVFAVQGSMSVAAPVLRLFLTEQLMTLVSMVGYGIVFMIGLNFIGVKNIKTANLLPALIVPVIYYFCFT